jgi:hypothetical protein
VLLQALQKSRESMCIAWFWNRDKKIYSMVTGQDPGKRPANERMTIAVTGTSRMRPGINIDGHALRITKALLLIAVCGAAIMSVSDMLLLGNPISGLQAFMHDVRNTVFIPYSRVVWGGMAGVLIGGPLTIAGYIALHRITRVRGGIQPMIMSGVFIYMVVMAVAAHLAYIYTGIAMKTDVLTGNATAVEFIFAQQNFLRMVLMLFNVTPLFIGSVLYMMIAAKGTTTLPKWMLFINPLLLNAVFGTIALVLPAPVGGFIALPSFNLAQLVFFTALFVHVAKLKPGIWNKGAIN